MTRTTGTLHDGQYIFLIISCSVLRRRDVLGKRCRENQIHIYVVFFLNRAAYEIMWKTFLSQAHHV